jgi:hypothetical protein
MENVLYLEVENEKLTISPSSYKDSKNHLRTLLSHDWYKVIKSLHSNLLNITNEFI